MTSSLTAAPRDTKTKGEINNLRTKGLIPAIVYGGNQENKKISLDKKKVKNLVYSENFLSNILNIKINGKEETVLPRDISYDPISDEPIHIDFLRIVKGSKLTLEIPVKFINNDKSPGLKKGGVLNIVRRKVELKCPTENIPTELLVDLENTDIGSSLKISSIKLPENVFPTIRGRDFVIATIVSPTIVIEPEKPAEEIVGEGETVAGEEGATTASEGEEKIDEKDKKTIETKEKKTIETKDNKSVDKKTVDKKKDPTKK